MRRRRLPGGLAVAALVAACVVPAAALAQAPLTVLSREGRRPLATTPIDGVDYVAVDDLAALFGTTARDDRVTGGLTISARGRTAVVTENQPVVSAAGRLVSLQAPARRREGRWFVPLDFLPRALSPLIDTRIDWRRPSRLMIVGDLRVPRVVARIDAGTTDVEVTFEVTPRVGARVELEPGRLVVHFDADAIDLSAPPVPPQTFLLSVAPGETPASVALATGPRYASHRFATADADAASGRVSVSLLPAALGAPASNPAPPAPPPSSPLPPTRGPGAVVIDPGHGGDELGTEGPGGTREKDVTLEVARRLRALIESRLGLTVYLTREDDRTLTLDERSAFANSHRADVFLSLHANASVTPGPRGAEVYYLSVERADQEARRKAEEGGATLPALGGGTRIVDLILWETAQARHLEQSAALAADVEAALRARVEMSPRAVQQAPLRVLVGANMPAVLVEMGYLSNPEQETQLVSGEYQDLVSQALFDAIVRFRQRVER